MNKRHTILLVVSLLLASCGENEVVAQNNPQQQETQQSESYNMILSINGRTLSATMVANSSTDALKAILEQENLTFSANDYGGFEKVGGIGHNLPQNNEQIVTAPGDIILYQGNSIIACPRATLIEGLKRFKSFVRDL